MECEEQNYAIIRKDEIENRKFNDQKKNTLKVLNSGKLDIKKQGKKEMPEIE